MGLKKFSVFVMMMAILSAIPSCSEADHRPEYQFQDTVNAVLAEYDLEPVEVIFRDLDNMVGVVECLPTNNQCDIVFDPCVFRLSYRLQQNIAVHEAAHYVNAQISLMYDHGRQWRQIVRGAGQWAYVEYPSRKTLACRD